VKRRIRFAKHGESSLRDMRFKDFLARVMKVELARPERLADPVEAGASYGAVSKEVSGVNPPGRQPMT
jgi:hypothetical protein